MSAFVQELRELLQRGKDLPTLPDVVFRLHQALDDNLSSEAEIAEIVETDPALTSRLCGSRTPPCSRPNRESGLSC